MEDVDSVMVDVTERGIVIEGLIAVEHLRQALIKALVAISPELRFDSAEATESPFGSDEDVHQGEFASVGGVVVTEKGGGEGIECKSALAGDDGVVGVDR